MFYYHLLIKTNVILFPGFWLNEFLDALASLDVALVCPVCEIWYYPALSPASSPNLR